MAFYTLLGGIIGAAAAAVPGLIDWASLTDRAAVKTANWHARVMIFTVVIFLASFYLRTTSGAQWFPSMPMLPFLLSVVGLLTITIGGWLGGELVFRHGVAVTEQAKRTPQQPDSQSHIRRAA